MKKVLGIRGFLYTNGRIALDDFSQGKDSLPAAQKNCMYFVERMAWPSGENLEGCQRGLGGSNR
jgi:hypothetical protein